RIFSAETQKSVQIETLSTIPTDWHPNGTQVLFATRTADTEWDLWTLPLADGAKPVRYLQSPFDQFHGNFSPDGNLVAYTSNESASYEVYAQTFPGSERKWQVSTNGGYEPRWRADGREIYYLSRERKLMAVAVAAGPKFGRPQTLFQTEVA